MASLLEFFRYARRRKQSAKDYFAFQRYQGRGIIQGIKNHVEFTNPLLVLDVGSGIGGYVYELALLDKVKVVSLDKNPLPVAIERYKEISKISKKMAVPTKRGANVLFNSQKIAVLEGDITNAPLKDQSFDVIIASSVIEHVNEQRKLVEECHRLLKPNGLFYLSFPPYYSPVGGHSISPLHYIPGKFPLWLYEKQLHKKQLDKKRHPTDHATFKYYGLVKTTIANVERMLSPYFTVREIKPRIFEFLSFLVHVPMLREIFVHHVEFFLVKK